MADSGSAGPYMISPSINVTPGIYDLQLTFELRERDNPENLGGSAEATVTLPVKNTQSDVVDFLGNIIHSDSADDSALTQNFAATAEFINLTPCTAYQVRVVGRQILSGISNTVIRDPYDSYDEDQDGITDSYDADSWSYDAANFAPGQTFDYESNLGNLAFYNTTEAGDGWVDAPKTGGCPSYGGGSSPVVTPTPTPTPTTPAPQIEQVKSSVYFGGDSSVLTKAALARISSLYSKIPMGAKNIRIVFKGFVSPTVMTSYDKKLAAARVAAVKAQLLKRGITATVVIPTLSVDKKSTAAKARRVDISVTYEMP